MSYDIVVFLGVYIFGIVTGVIVIRYGLGLGSKMHVRASENVSLGETINENSIDQEYTK